MVATLRFCRPRLHRTIARPVECSGGSMTAYEKPPGRRGQPMKSWEPAFWLAVSFVLAMISCVIFA